MKPTLNQKTKILLITLLTLISGCSKIPECADSKVINTLKDSILAKEDLKHEDKLKFSVDIVTEDKSTKDDNARLCKGTLSVSINDEIISEFKKFNYELQQKTGLSFQDVKLKPLIIEVDYKVKLNEVRKGEFFIQSSWSKFSDTLDYTPIKQLENKEKILELAPSLKAISSAEEWLKNEPKNSKEVYDYFTENIKLALKYCTEQIEDDSSSINVWCHYGNNVGEVITYHSLPVNPLALSMLALMGGGINKSNTIKSKESLQKIINSNVMMQFSDSNTDSYSNLIK